MNLDKKVKVIRSKGSTCFLCHEETTRESKVIQVTVEAKITDPLFGLATATIPVVEEAHQDCAAELHKVLGMRIKEAAGEGRS